MALGICKICGTDKWVLTKDMCVDCYEKNANLGEATYPQLDEVDNDKRKYRRVIQHWQNRWF